MINNNKQTAPTVSQIENNKPEIPKTFTMLEGQIGGSTNGGMNKVIGWKKCMAGEKHKELTIDVNIQLATPKSPAYQKLRGEILTYYVPNSRIWNNAEKYTAQKGGATETKIKEIPNLKGKKIPFISNYTQQNEINLTQTTAWRDCWISDYIPRIGLKEMEEYSSTEEHYSINEFPPISALPLRGRIAIYNDFERNKEYDEIIQEYKGDTISDYELNSYLPYYSSTCNIMRAKRPNSYYTNYRTELQGFETEIPPTENMLGGQVSNLDSLTSWVQVENLISESREQANNSQLNDWQIIRKLRGSKELWQGKTQLIGRKTFDLNYSAVTQNAYNNNEEIEEQYRVMGKQGAYSYTYLNMPIAAGFETDEEGYIHVILHIYAETVYETAIDRNLLNITPLDEYRPDLKKQIDDVIFRAEYSTNWSVEDDWDYENVTGFKRKFTELGKLPNCINGDMTSQPWYDVELKNINNSYRLYLPDTIKLIETQETYQFYMEGAYIWKDKNQFFIIKEWKDYTDFLLNKNQAIKNEIEEINSTNPNNRGYEHRIKGQQQIIYAGKLNLIAELPIDNEIITEWQDWGQH